MSEPKAGVASPKERHETLYGALTRTYSSMVEAEFKHATVYALFIGWILTAERAQRLIASSAGVRVSLTITALAYTVFHALWVFRFFRRSSILRKQLDEVGFVPPNDYKSEVIEKYQVVYFSAAHFVAWASVAVIVWFITKALPS